MKKNLIFILSGLMAIASADAQNVGIGTTSPAYKLDLVGRMRIKQNASQTAGIFFDGVTLANRSFIGTFDDDHMGIFGAITGWKFVFNVENGNVGMGVTAPTATLDLNGSLRIRSDFPKVGSVLTSEDTEGNASWKSPIAFRVAGLSGAANQSIPQNTWTKVQFNTSPSYNLGLNYQPFLSQFIVGDRGVYHFNAQLSFTAVHASLYRGIRFMVNRNGNVFTIAQQDLHQGGTTEALVLNALNGLVVFDRQLEPGDLVWVEVYVGSPIKNTDNGSFVTSTALIHNTFSTWFSGHIVTRL